MRKWMWITLVAAFAACGSGDGNGNGSDGGGGNGGSGAGGGGGGVTGLPSTLAGTWELSGSSAGSVDGLLVLSSTSAHLTVGGGTFDLQAGSTPSFTWSTASEAQMFTASHTPVAVDFGALPLALGGDWAFHGPGNGSCVGSIRGDAASGGCSGAGEPPSPVPSLNRQVQVTHASKLDSIFGALGGTWTLTDNGGGACTFTFQGATLSASCKDGSDPAGGVTITFSDGLASGFTDSGAEFSARRR